MGRMENKLSGWFQVTKSKARMCNDNLAFQYIYREKCKRGTEKICWRSTAGNHHCEVGAIHDDVVMLAEKSEGMERNLNEMKEAKDNWHMRTHWRKTKMIKAMNARWILTDMALQKWRSWST